MKHVTHTVYLGIGSNLGDRRANCRKALKILGREGIRIVRESSLLETEPWGMEEQPAFINMAAEIQTALTPHELLDLLKQIEKEMGRRKSVRWGPRIIDIDILIYDDLVQSESDLTIPHPMMHKRRFVLDPLSEIAPAAVHPLLGRTIADLRAELGKRGC